MIKGLRYEAKRKAARFAPKVRRMRAKQNSFAVLAEVRSEEARKRSEEAGVFLMCCFETLYNMFAGEKGFEPLTFGFGDHCSTIVTIPLF